MSVRTLTVGCDPELFLVDEFGKFTSSIGLVGGSKAVPRPIGNGCSVQEDNVAVEFNIEPAATKEAFVLSCQYALSTLSKQMAERGLFINLSASQSFPQDQLQHIKARLFGCDPDFNAWTKVQNPKPKAEDPALRSCGGHVHFGTDVPVIQGVRWADVVMGLKSVLEDEDVTRRLLYGKAGAFRKKQYGFEYRTLSNYWLKTQESMEAVFERAQEVVERVRRGDQLTDDEGTPIQRAINESNKELATTLLTHYGY